MFRYISVDSKQPALARDPLDLVCLTCQAIVNTNLVYLLCDRFDRLNLYGMVVSSCVHRRLPLSTQFHYGYRRLSG
jgi:hypothetical protein